jgi:dynamin 1-like protein
MLINYHSVVKKNICDYIPKIVITLLVKKATEECETVLIRSLYKESEIERLIVEDEKSL